MIKKVRLLKTLKAGKNVWIEGEEMLHPHIHPDILSEVLLGTGTVEVLEESFAAVVPIVDSNGYHVTRIGSVVTDNFFDKSKFSPNSPSLLKRKRLSMRA